MNTNKIEQWILLRQSGELSPRKCRQLDILLARHPELQQFENDLAAISLVSRESTTTADVPQLNGATRARLFEATEQAPATLRFAQWKFLAPLAAAALLILGISLALHRTPTPGAPIAHTDAAAPAAEYAWDDNLEYELDNLQAVLANLNADLPQANRQTPDEDTLIRELLELEGARI